MKRNTTSTLKVKVKAPLDNVVRLEFIFKKEKSEVYPALLRKEFDKDKIPVGEVQHEYFFVLLKFKASETMKIPEGDVYMDTRIVLAGNIVPPTNICCFPMRETLFDDVFESTDAETSGGEQQ